MSLLQKAIEAAQSIEGLAGYVDALIDLRDAQGALETAAAASKIAAEMAVTGLTVLAVRPLMSSVRLGLALSGQIWKWDAITWAAGVGTGGTAGLIIDLINEQNYGSDIYDLTHPDPLTNQYWWQSRIAPRRDPLAIDLDGDGIETIGIPASGPPILFDHDANGVRTGTGGLKGDDAWLVLDRDGNGSIDSGRELFGVDTLITVTEPIFGAVNSTPITLTRNARNGFEALRSVDTGNGTAGSAGFGDGVFDSKDAAFSQVKLWQDLNQDGISQSTELFTLADKVITSIGLNASTATTNLGNGNTVTGQATVTRSNGSTTVVDSVDLQASNLNLADNPFHRQFPDTIPLTAAAKALPEMGGSGWLRDMREAMSLGTASAQQLVQSSRLRPRGGD